MPGILKHHQADRCGRVVLRGHMHPVGVLRSGIRLARQHERPSDVAFRHADVRQRIWTDLVVRIDIRGRSLAAGRRNEHCDRPNNENCEDSPNGA